MSSAGKSFELEQAEDDEECGLVLEKPIDGLKIGNHLTRARAWRRLARRLRNSEPECFGKGKGRWGGKVHFDMAKQRICWNDQALPNTKCWRSNALPGEHMGKVVLVLMEKNEAPILERMLETLVHDIDAFVVLDTGSTDNSREIIWDFLVEKHKKRGHIYNSDWYDFGTCRTIAVQLAHGAGDWLLLMDADYRLVRKDAQGSTTGSSEWRDKLPAVSAGAPMMLLLGTTGDLSYARPHLVRSASGMVNEDGGSEAVRYCYHNRTHEYLAVSSHDKSGVAMRQETFPWLLIDHLGDGCSKADKLPRDVVMCIMDGMDEPESERSFFYLANSLRQLGMAHEALRAHKHHLRLCRWDEEQLCGSKGMLEALVQTRESNERQLALVLHASFQNPHRLEMLSQYCRRLRSQGNLWPAWAHVGACLGSLFTHNAYPAHQKLFVEKWETTWGIWQEISICAFYSLPYFELGLFLSRKLCQDPEFKTQQKGVQDMTLHNRSLFEGRLREWISKGVRLTPPIRKHLMERAHKLFAQGRFSRAKDLYGACLHPIVLRELVGDPNLLPPQDDPAEAKVLAEQTEVLSTATFHKTHRLSAWAYGKALHHAVTEIDQERALCCYQMGRCEEKLSGHANQRIFVAVHYIDALKFVPLYAPAIAALYDMTLLAPSDLTRAILYLMRAVTVGPAAQAAVAPLKPVRLIVDAGFADQSVACRVAPLPAIPSTLVIHCIPHTPSPMSAMPAIAAERKNLPRWCHLVPTVLSF